MKNTKGISIAALVLGIVACVLSWWGIVWGIIAIVCGVVGLILAIMARKNEKTSLNTAALIICIIGVVLAVIGTIACGICACVAVGAASAVESGEIDINGIADQLESAVNEIATTVGN